MIFELGGSEGQAEGMGAKENCCYRTSTEENKQQVLWPLTTENKNKFNIDYAVFWHLSWIFT